MKEFFKSGRFKIILCFMAFLIGVMVFSVTKGGYALKSNSFITTVTKPFRTISNSIAVKMETNADKRRNADKYYADNEELRKQIGELNDKLTEFEAMRAELEELRKFVDIKEKHPDYILSEPCKVIGYTTNDPFKSFIIDKGADYGIEPFSPVVTSEGLIGIVTEVSATGAIVRTLLSPDLRISAVTASGDLAGIIEGNIEQAVKNETRLIHLTPELTLIAGEMLVTTNTTGIFPSGYAIGYVNRVDRDESGLAMYASIEPAARIERLTSVIVIKDFEGKNLAYEN